MDVCYRYDGSFPGFLCCVFESYVHKETPAVFLTAGDDRLSLYPSRDIATDRARALRVYRSLHKKLSPLGQELAAHGFLTCLPEKEKAIFDFIALGYEMGPAVVRNLTDPRVALLERAVRFAEHEAHLYTGFARFTEAEGILLGEIEPKNRVLPLLRDHFCARFPNESFVLHDRTYGEALFHEPGRWAIVPVTDFHIAPPDDGELNFRRLWKKFYDTIAIEGRINPKLRQGHMPKRYWNLLTEFQDIPASQQSLDPGQ